MAVKIHLTINDMACSMCEAHINDAIRRAFPVKKVKSSHRKGKTDIVAEGPIPEEDIRRVIADTGYTLSGIEYE